MTMTKPPFINVDLKPVDDEIARLEKGVVRARRAIADLITEQRVLGSVEPDQSDIARKYGLEG
jgi:hypothetical protein